MKSWSEAVGIAQDNMANTVSGMLVMAICYFILVLGLALVFAAAEVKGAGHGLAWGLAISFFFLVTTLFTNVMFENRPSSLFFVNGSYSLVKFAMVGAILGGWQIKIK